MTRIADLDIREVARTAGLTVKGNRAAASHRGSKDFNLGLNPDKGCWRDFANGQGGGIRRLVEVVLHCDRSSALTWLAHNFGIAQSERTPEERREYARNIERARLAAAAIAERRDAYLLDLRTASGILLAEYHRLLRLAEAEHCIETQAKADDSWELLEKLASRRDRLNLATGPELVRFFSEFESEAK